MSYEIDEPIIRRRAVGGWPATAPKSARTRIGVVGATEEAARSAYLEAARRWAVWLTDTAEEGDARQVTVRHVL